MDDTDKIIMEELMKNSKITMKELGEKVHLSGQATSTRVIKHEEAGVIRGYTIDVNCPLYGYSVHAMMNIFTKDVMHQSYLKFVNSQKDYVIHNYKISGDGCYLLECRFPTNEVMDEFLVNLNKYVNYKLTIILKDMIEPGIVENV